MKRLLYAMMPFVLMGLFLSCQKVEHDYIDGKTPDQRVREHMKQVRETLTSAPHGWVAYLGTPGGLSFTYYMEFNEGNRVRMYSDFDDNSLVEGKESSYALRNTGIPSVIFDSYNYIHIPADPNPNVNNGTQGVGLSGDFEFSIRHVSVDTIVLMGNLRNNELRLVRANVNERTAVEEGEWGASINRFKNYFESNANNYITVSVNGSQQIIGVDLVDGRRFEFYGIENGNMFTNLARAFYTADERMDLGNSSYKGIVFTQAYFGSDEQLRIKDAQGTEYLVLQAASSVVPLPPFFDRFGYGKNYNYFLFNPGMATLEFRPIWDEIQQEMVTEADRYIRDIRFSVLPSGQLLVRVYRHAAGTGTSGSVSFSRLYFNAIDHGNEVVSYTYTASGTDGSSSSSALRNNSDKLLEFLANNKFIWDWRTRAMTQGGLFVVDDNGVKTGLSVTGTLAND